MWRVTDKQTNERRVFWYRLTSPKNVGIAKSDPLIRPLRADYYDPVSATCIHGIATLRTYHFPISSSARFDLKASRTT